MAVIDYISYLNVAFLEKKRMGKAEIDFYEDE
jgi:hypothetical protein